jgi:hypothetical protein
MIFSLIPKKSSPFLIMGSLFLSFSVFAQSIPEAELATVKTDCIQKCEEAQEEGLTCDILCSCVSNRFESELNYSEFKSILREMDAGIFSPATKRFLDETGLVCTLELGNILAEQEKLKKNKN